MTGGADELKVAIDVGPLSGLQTGVAVVTEALVRALGERSDLVLHPYVVSRRATPRPGHAKLPLPGIVASHVWSRTDRPLADRWIGTVDVVHGTNNWAPPVSMPSVITVHDCWFLRHPDDTPPVIRRMGKTLRRAVRRGAWVHAVSDATADEVREILGTDRVRTARSGRPPTLSTTEPPSDLTRDLRGRPYVLALGTEVRRKDLTTLVLAFAEVATATASLDLVLAGAPGDHSRAVDDAIARLEPALRRRVHRLGVVDEPMKAWLLRNASVLAYPSLDEGFGFPILEAQTACVPVVASDVGSVREIGGDGVVVVEVGSSSAFAEAITSLVDGSRSRLELITAGTTNLTRFSWEQTAATLSDLYRDAIDDAR